VSRAQAVAAIAALVAAEAVTACGGYPEVVHPLPEQDAAAADATPDVQSLVNEALGAQEVVLLVMDLARDVECEATSESLPVERVCGPDGCRTRPADLDGGAE